MDFFSFEELRVYQETRNLIREIYLLLKKFPPEEKYALCNQVRRSTISIASNIAEGSGRISAKEKCHFVEIAYGSLTESACQMQIACDLGYISDEEFQSLRDKMENISRMLSGLKNYFSSTKISIETPESLTDNR